MHYVLSFCKVTAASKIFSRNFYLPLLKPLTPQDALRTFRITGKWLLGAKIQHYIPVLLNHTKKRSQKLKNYGKIKHEIMEDYAYMSPTLDPDNIESHKNLYAILSSKSGQGCYVYTVDDKNYNLVVDASLENALRDGDVIDIVMSQGTDKILVKLRDFKKVPVEIFNYTANGTLFKGEGTTTKEDERHHHHGKNTMSIAKIFEDMERKEELWEIELKRLLEKRKKQHGEGTKEWIDMVKAATANMDWKKYERQVKRLVQYIEEPIVEYHIGMEIEELSKTADISETLATNPQQIINQLPTLEEIPELINNMADAVYHEFEIENIETPLKRLISGVKITLPSGVERFIIGQIVKAEEGEVFIPGQTVENEFGTEYVPGITINADNTPILITGLIVGEADNKNPMFVPIESSITQQHHLSFTTTKEERVKYKPRKVPVRKVIKSLAQNPDECYEEYYYDDEGLDDFDYDSPLKVKKKLRRVVKKRKVAPPGCVYNVQEEDQYEEEEYSEYEEVDEEEEYLNELLLEHENTSIGETINQVSEIPVETGPTLEEIIETYKKGVDPRVKVHREMLEEERLMIKAVNAKITELIVNIEAKTAEVKQKLEELRNLTVVKEIDPVSTANLDDATEIASTITNHLHEGNVLSEILLTMVRRVLTFSDKNNIKVYNINSPSAIDNETKIDARTKRREKLKIILKTAIVAANNVFKNRPQDEVSALKAIGTVLVLAFEDQEKLVVELCDLMKVPLERSEICALLLQELTQKYRKDKLKTLKSVINTNGKAIDDSTVIEKFRDILEKKGDIIGAAFKKIAKNNTDLVLKIIDLVKYDFDTIQNERYAIQALREAIVNAVKKIAEDDLRKLVDTAKDHDLQELITDAVYFSHFLSLNGTAEDLKRLPQNYRLITSSNKESLALLNRLMIIRKLAENDRGQAAALKEIRKNPEFGKTNPRIRQLIRESASLISTANPIQNSKEIPVKLMEDQNRIALEDFLIQRSRSELPIMISKRGRQVVIPGEMSTDVLQGRVPYLLLDEEGANNIKAVKKFNNLVINNNYKEKVVEDYSPFGTKERLLNNNNNKWAEVPNFNKANLRNRIRGVQNVNGRITA